MKKERKLCLILNIPFKYNFSYYIRAVIRSGYSQVKQLDQRMLSRVYTRIYFMTFSLILARRHASIGSKNLILEKHCTKNFYVRRNMHTNNY